jgi:hypothetical protein
MVRPYNHPVPPFRDKPTQNVIDPIFYIPRRRPQKNKGFRNVFWEKWIILSFKKGVSVHVVLDSGEPVM